jgi:hypothetical protein
MRRLARFHWHRLIGASAALVAAGVLVPGTLKAPQLVENRVLAKLPAMPRDLAALQALPKAMDAYVGDHFPARTYLIPWLNGLRLAFGVSGSEKIIVGREGWLFYDNDTHLGDARGAPGVTRDQARRWLLTLAGRTEALERQGIPYVVLLAPLKEAVYPQFAPDWYDGPSPDRPSLALTELSARAGVGQVVYPYEPIAEQAHWGYKAYSRHDTHWTGLGAYTGYAALMTRLQALGVTEGPRPFADFSELEAEPLAQPHDLAQMLGVASFVGIDFPQIVDPDAAKRLKVTYLTADREWRAPQVIDTGQAGKPVLLITRDSFATALTPFLYGHFSRIVMVHNDDGDWREDLIARFRPDVVILEVVESGALPVMTSGPPASSEARVRIEAALDAPRARTPPRRWRTVRAGEAIDGTDAGQAMRGTAGDDTMSGRAGDDRMEGLGGNDILRGGRGRDTIFGGDGDDLVGGDRDDDVLTGGRGADTFLSFAGAGLDRVRDFSVIEGDRVVLAAGTAYRVRQVGADTHVEMKDATLILVGIAEGSLPQGWISVE